MRQTIGGFYCSGVGACPAAAAAACRAAAAVAAGAGAHIYLKHAPSVCDPGLTYILNTHPLFWRKPIELEKIQKTRSTNTKPIKINLQFRLIITRGPRNERTRGPEDQEPATGLRPGGQRNHKAKQKDVAGRKGPRNKKTRGAQDRRPWGQGSPGPEDRGTAGPGDHGTREPKVHLQAKPFKGRPLAQTSKNKNLASFEV